VVLLRKEKLKFAFYWAASCGGCEIAVLDTNEKILDILTYADIVFWPVAMDIKYKDVKAFKDRYIDVCFFNGAIRTEEQERMAKLLRKKSKVMVAFGSCAYQGGIPGLANAANRKEVFERAYLQSPCTNNPNCVTPKTSFIGKEGELKLPEFFDTVYTLDQTVDVDYYVPGCPPHPDLVAEAIEIIARNELPPKGSVLAPEKSVCDECPRKKEDKKISEICRVYEIDPDPEICLLEQGIICMGPVTRGGCGAQCINANMPCTGCGGPCPNQVEQGAAMISALSSILGVGQEKDPAFNAEKLIAQIKDPLGTFYKYSLPASLLRRRIIRK
jgi:F420-non-reducing hydrogenase small subunit